MSCNRTTIMRCGCGECVPLNPMTGRCMHCGSVVCPLSAQCERIIVDGKAIGVLIRLRPPGGSHNRDGESDTPRPARSAFGWQSLRDSQLGIAHYVAAGMTN